MLKQSKFVFFFGGLYGHCCAAKPPVPVDRSVGFGCTPKGEQILNELGGWRGDAGEKEGK